MILRVKEENGLFCKNIVLSHGKINLYWSSKKSSVAVC